jgi:hypothetical protein
MRGESWKLIKKSLSLVAMGAVILGIFMAKSFTKNEFPVCLLKIFGLRFFCALSFFLLFYLIRLLKFAYEWLNGKTQVK